MDEDNRSSLNHCVFNHKHSERNNPIARSRREWRVPRNSGLTERGSYASEVLLLIGSPNVNMCWPSTRSDLGLIALSAEGLHYCHRGIIVIGSRVKRQCYISKGIFTTFFERRISPGSLLHSASVRHQREQLCVSSSGIYEDCSNNHQPRLQIYIFCL